MPRNRATTTYRFASKQTTKKQLADRTAELQKVSNELYEARVKIRNLERRAEDLAHALEITRSDLGLFMAVAERCRKHGIILPVATPITPITTFTPITMTQRNVP